MKDSDMNIVRYSIIFTLLIYVSPSLTSQVDTSKFVFPLEIGSVWTYSVSNDQYSGHHFDEDISLRLDSDTSMPNGLKYFQLPPMAAFIDFDSMKTFLRKTDLKVFQYDPVDSGEFLLYDFSAKLGDTISILALDPFQGVVLTDTGTYTLYPIGNFKMLCFSIWRANQYGIVGQLFDWVADSLGIVIHPDGHGTLWRLIGANVNGRSYGTVLSVEDRQQTIPKSFRLYQNYPNPFNPTTTISFDLPNAELVHISIYDYLGRLLSSPLNQYENAGRHEFVFNSFPFSTGLYYCRAVAGRSSSVVKMLLLK